MDSNKTKMEKAFEEIERYHAGLNKKIPPKDFQREMTAFVNDCFKRHGINKAFNVTTPYNSLENGDKCHCFVIYYSINDVSSKAEFWSADLREFISPYEKREKTARDKMLDTIFDEISKAYAGDDKNDNVFKLRKGMITEADLRKEIKSFTEDLIILNSLDGKVNVSRPRLICDLGCLTFNVAVTYNDNGERKTARRRFETDF